MCGILFTEATTMITVTLALLITAVSLTWAYCKWHHSFWSSRGIKGPSPKPFIGNFTQLLLGEKWEFIKQSYDKYKKEKVFGVYEVLSPVLFICDPDIIKQVLVKDFNNFTDRRSFKFPNSLKWMEEMLSMTSGDQWKKLRSTMTPTFSSGKIKSMYPIINEQANSFVRFCKKYSESGEKIDIKEAFGRFTMDVIAESAFGIKCDSLVKKESIFSQKAEKLFSTSASQTIITAIFMSLPKITNILSVIVRPERTWNFFVNVCQSTIKSRRKNNIVRGDFVDLLLEEQNKQKLDYNESKDYKMTETTVLAQSVMFLVTGYDTTANTLSVAAYHLANNKNILRRLRTELNNILSHHGSFNYQNIVEATYLDACVSEALRLNPPAPWLERQSAEDYIIKGTKFTIPKGTLVGIPAWGLHRDSEFWPFPETYNPERFLPENKSKIVPYTYMPFGIGPRNCIAMRFALLEVKLCLAYFVVNYDFSLAPGHEMLKLANGGRLVKPDNNSVALILKKLIED